MGGRVVCTIVLGLILLLRVSFPLVFADQMDAEVRIAPGSSISGCEKTNECFIPYTATIDVGGMVTWINDDTAPHTSTSVSLADGSDGVFDSKLVMAGDSFSHTFDEPGKYPYFCLVHPWMTGMVVVQAVAEYQLIDSDGDGIPDIKDHCPTQPETFNGFMDQDGCPDALVIVDVDADGIRDFLDNCPTQPETFNGFMDEDGCPDKLESGRETDVENAGGTMSIDVEIETNVENAGGTMSIDVEFRDVVSGELVQNINYDIHAKQGNQVILDEAGEYDPDGHGNHITNALPRDASDNDPVDVEVTLNGIGQPDEPSTWTGPQGQTENVQVVPEFDAIAMMILVSGIGGIVALCAKSKLIMRI